MDLQLFHPVKFHNEVNLRLNKRASKYEVIFKTLNPLPSNIDVFDQFRIAEDITDKISLDVDLGLGTLSDLTIPLKGPNFKIDTRLLNSVPSSFKNYDEILDYTVTSSFENLLSKLGPNLESIDVPYDYIRPVSESFEGESDDTPFHFENPPALNPELFSFLSPSKIAPSDH